MNPRIILPGLAVIVALAIPTVAAAQGSPRSPASRGASKIIYIGGQAFRTVSVDGDAGGGQMYFPFGPMKLRKNADIEVGALAGVSVGGETSGGLFSQYVGGVQIIDHSLFKWPIYFQVLGGAIHFSGETDFMMRLNTGLMIPIKESRYQIYVQVGLPIIFFSENHEVGTEVAGGLAIKLGK